MRRDESDGGSLGIGSRKRGGARPDPLKARSHLRRLALEGLERRELMSTIPSATQVPGAAGNLVDINRLVNSPFTNLANDSSPSVAVDPADPSKLISAWVTYDPAHPIGAGQVTTVVQSAYSIDGGKTWTALGFDGEVIDFSQDQKSGPKYFTQTTDPSVGFDRSGNAYILDSTRNAAGTVGFLGLDRIDMSKTTASVGPVQTQAMKPVYSWSGVDAASYPTLAVDTNLPVYTDLNSKGGTVSQVDPYAGNVYIAWASTDTNTAPVPIPNFNPNTIKFMSSSDQGSDFTHAAFVDDTSNANFGGFHQGTARYTQPTIAISQGSAIVPGGQVSIVFDDWGSGINATPKYDLILHQFDQLGGTSETYTNNGGGIIPAQKGGGSADIPVATDFPIDVNITDPKFTTLQALDVTLQMAYPNLGELSATLYGPSGQQVVLWLNGVNAAGQTVNQGASLTGSTLGIPVVGPGDPNAPVTTFDPEAVRSIEDGAATPFLGHFRPVDAGSLANLQGEGVNQINGRWTLQIVSYRNQTTFTFPAPNVFTFGLNFTSGVDVGYNPTTQNVTTDSVVADPLTAIDSFIGNINPTNPQAVTGAGNVLQNTGSKSPYVVNNYTTTVSDNPANGTKLNVQAPTILASPSVAVDNTLGAYSQHPGRIYVAYVGRYDDYINTPKDSTQILLVASDDGGNTWTAINPAGTNFGGSTGVQVNDDNAALDGSTESSPGSNFGRPKLLPQVQVDAYTGAVVVSFLDARDDPSRARVSTYIAVSSDGGNSFSPETYANPSSANPSTAALGGVLARSPAPVIDAITGKVVNLGPTPDNQSSGNGNADPVFGYGTRTGLSVADGRIIPVWASNQNLGSSATPKIIVPLSIVSTVLTTAAGPRVLSGTQGPVGQLGDTVNPLRAADGTPIANSFLVTFDRPIDPATFVGDVTSAGAPAPIGTGDVRVFYNDAYSTGPIVAAYPATPINFTGIAAGKVFDLVVAGHPGDQLLSGTLTLGLAEANLSSLTIQLVTPSGNAFNLPALPGNSVSTTFALPVSALGGPLDGTYHLIIKDPNVKAATLNAFSLALNGQPIGLRVTGITPVPNLADPLDDGSRGYTTFRVNFDPHEPGTNLATGVGTYSYIVRPNLSDRMRSVQAPVASAGLTNFAIAGTPSATARVNDNTATAVALGQPYQFLLDNVDGNALAPGSYPNGNIAGTVSAVITASQLPGTGQPAPDASQYVIYIGTPDGRYYPLTGGTLGSNNTVLTFDAVPFTVTNSATPFNGTYTLFATDTSSSSLIKINSFSLSLNTKYLIPTSKSSAVIENAQAGQVPAPFSGTTTTTSTIDLAGHPGKVIGGGSITLSLNANNVQDLTIQLVGPTGLVFTLPRGSGNTLNQNIALPSGFAGLVLDGQYKLQITGGGGSDAGVLNSWQINLNPESFVGRFGANTTAQSLTVPGAINSTIATDLTLPPGASGTENLFVSLSSVDANQLGTLSNVTIELVFPDGSIYTLPQQTGSSINKFFPIPRTFPVTVGSFALKVLDGTTGEVTNLNRWTLANVPDSLNGNSMDQNANGVGAQDPETVPYTGTSPGDDFVAPNPSTVAGTTTTFSGAGLFPGPYGATSLPLIVSGPHITSIAATGSSGTTTGNSTDNTVINDQVKSVDVLFDRNVQIGSATASQILNLTGPTGPISTPRTFTSAGISKTFASTDVNHPIPLDGGSGLSSNLTIFNTGLSVASLAVSLNITDANDKNLSVTLVHSGPTAATTFTVPLVLAGNAGGANFTNTVFSDLTQPNGNLIPFTSGAAPYAQTYIPAYPKGSTTLAMLAGAPLDGSWTLQVVDSTASKDATGKPTGATQGTLNAWSLQVIPQIPRAIGSTLTSTLTVSNPDNSFLISHLAVRLNISAGKESDLTANLVAPNGTIVPLFANNGGASNLGFNNTTFDDSASITLLADAPPYTLTYRPIPVAGMGSLTSLIGSSVNGTWKLVLTDQTTDNLPAVLNSWSLIATPQLKITPQQVYTSNDTTTKSYASTDTGTQIYPSSDVTFFKPAAIPTALGGSVSSSISFPSTADNPFLIANLRVALSIAYPRDSNLAVSLTAPNGQVIQLFAGVGGSGANFGYDPNSPSNNNPTLTGDGNTPFDYTILGDGGTQAISSGTAPFDSGPLPIDPLHTYTTYRPSYSAGSATLGSFTGTAIDGTWTLTVTNTLTGGPAGGIFNGWALLAQPEAALAKGALPAASVQPDEPVPTLFPVLYTNPTTGLTQPAPQPLISTITLPSTNGTFLIAPGGMGVALTLTAANANALSASLVAPDGTSEPLFAAGGLNAGAISQKAYTFTGLKQFDGLKLDGSWKLQVSDFTGAQAVLNGWSLLPTPQAIAQQQASEPVPDTPASTLSSSIVIADTAAINHLRVRLNLTSTKDANLTATLLGPNGQSVKLFNAANTNGVNFSNTVFDDQAALSIDSTAAAGPYSGTFQPEGKLSGLTGSIAGTWTLVIVDTAPDGTQSLLNGWSLINTPPASATVANDFQVGFPTQQLSGTYALTVGSGIVAADGTPANPNLNAGVDVLRGTSAAGVTATVGTSYPAAAVPVNIPVAPAAAGAVTTLTSQVFVPDNFLIQGVIQTPTGVLPGLTVSLGISFPNDPKLTAVLIAPDGSQIALFTNVGNGPNRANFTNTVLDDTVNPPASVDIASAPFAGRFNPETPLSNLQGHLSAGTWTLKITNADATSMGTLNNWALNFQKPLPSSGLGDPVADRQTETFRIFNLAPSNPLANDTWTAVGPAGITTTQGLPNTYAGSASSVAYDPSDPTRNTVFVAASSGGIWKTSNFLTSAAGGPTYIPLTDFGPNFGLDVGSIAVFGRNGDPSQSVVFAGTGFAAATYPYNGAGLSYSNYGGNAGRGVGFLRSHDGGTTWSLLDSTINVDSNGVPLPENSPLRDHTFVGDFTYKVVVDPNPEANGQTIIYAALGGPTGGLYRSLDSGDHWTLLSGGFTNPNTGQPAAATDIVLDANSRGTSTGPNDNIVYAAFEGLGVYISSNQGQGLRLMTGMAGQDALIQGDAHFPPITTKVNNAAVTPNGPNGRIVLAKPALTGNAAVDLLYQDWLYAAVETPAGHLLGLYVTKDRGENWTKALLGDLPSNTVPEFATPTNNDAAATPSYDPTSNLTGLTATGSTGSTTFTSEGNYNLSLTIDPTNPNIVYLGGSQDFQTSGLIRVDLTDIFDAHNFTSFDSQSNDGGKLLQDSNGAFVVASPNLRFPYGAEYIPNTPGVGSVGYTTTPTPLLNLRHAPNTGLPGSSPFNVGASLAIAGTSTDYGGAYDFVNNGSHVKWTAFDEILKANPGDPTGSTNIHGAQAFVDPVTGQVRLIFADDQGVFSALVNPDGTINNGIGTDVAANYSRNGNLQDEQFYYGAAQPSNLAAQAAGALFYASGQGILAAQSDANLLNNGNLTWDDSAVLNPALGSQRNTGNNSVISSSDRRGVGIATDQTGGSTASGPTGSGPSTYEYNSPSLGGSISDFFRVNGVGQTTGLVGNINTEYPFGNYQFNAGVGTNAAGLTNPGANNGLIPEGNFAVNPINGSDVLISSTDGVLYETVTKGVTFLQVGQAGDFGQAGQAGYASALAYGAPDPAAPVGVGNLNNFLYVGTIGGTIAVSRTGGQAVGNNPGWFVNSTGLDGSTVVGIYPSPDRGSHEAYAVTLRGVYYTADSTAIGTATSPTWVNITGNLAQIQYNPFGNASLAQGLLSTYGGAPGGVSSNLQFGGFRSVVADYRYAIPDPQGNVHPVLYVAGYGGVFRSLDNGQTWTAFPNTSFDGSPVDGGYLPNVQVSNLQLNLGAINPATGRPQQVTGDPEVLLATTFGRGAFAIRLAPDVFPNSIGLDPNLPAPNGSASGLAHGNPRLTNVLQPYIDGISEISNFGNSVKVSIIDQSNGLVIGTGTTDTFGHFVVQIVNSGNDPSFFLDGVKTIGLQATDSAGAKGNITTFTYTLKSTKPATPGNPILDPGSDSGRSNTDGITNFDAVPTSGPTAPVFDVATTEPGTTTVELLRSTSASGPFAVVATAAGGTNPDKLVDTALFNQLYTTVVTKNADGTTTTTYVPNPTAGVSAFYYYETDQVDQAGNVSNTSGVTTIDVITTTPSPVASLGLDPSTNSSGNAAPNYVTNNIHPLFDVSGVLPGDQVELFRSINGSTPLAVGLSNVNTSSAAVALKVGDSSVSGASPDGIYLYQAVQIDIAGNISPLDASAPSNVVQITTKLPNKPTLQIVPGDDTGAPNNPQVTRVRTPHFFGAGTAGLKLDIINVANNAVLASTVALSDNSYQTQITTPLADGTYTFEARTTDKAGNQSFSNPLRLTIIANGPQIVPSLALLAADDTGIKGDGITANHRPRFVGKTDAGDTVTLFSINAQGQYVRQSSTTASTINGTFTLQLPFNLNDGNTSLVAQTSDLAGNTGPFSASLGIRIITVAGDYAGTGAAQYAVFRPLNSTFNGTTINDAESYIVQGVGTFKVDSTPGRDIPVQYDFEGDGRVDPVAYRFNTAEYFGTRSTAGALDQQFGQGGRALPVSGYYSGDGTFIYAGYNPNTAVWSVNLPVPGGQVLQFGAPGVDVPVPAAYDGRGTTEIATFRTVNTGNANDLDSFNVLGPKGGYAVSFTNPAVTRMGFTYKAGDLPAPADYDGLGRDEFAIYRPSTGQFFILNTPNVNATSTWSLRTVSVSLPGGPNPNDVPVSEDYQGTGKADPTVYRPSTSTFFAIQNGGGQQNTQFGYPGVDVAAAGPLIYRLTALKGQYSSTDGYPVFSRTGGGGTTAGIHIDAITAGPSGGSNGSAAQGLTTAIQATAINIPATPVAAAPAPATPAVAIPTPADAVVTAPRPVAQAATIKAPVVVGSKTPKVSVTAPAIKRSPGVEPAKAHARAAQHQAPATARPAAKARATSAPAAHAGTPTTPAASSAQHHAAIAAALQHLGSLKKGREND